MLLLLPSLFRIVFTSNKLTLTVLTTDYEKSPPEYYHSGNFFPWHWRNVRPVMMRAVNDYNMESTWDFNLEFISDNKCTYTDIIHSGTLRYNGLYPDQSVCCSDIFGQTQEQCCDNYAFTKRLSDVYVGLTCDYSYFPFIELARDFNEADLDGDFVMDGTGFPNIAVGYRSMSTRFKDGIPKTSFRSFPNLIRLGPTIEHFQRPIKNLIDKFGWKSFSIFQYSYLSHSNSSNYGFPYGDGYSDGPDKGFMMYNLTSSRGAKQIYIDTKCTDSVCSEKSYDCSLGSQTLVSGSDAKGLHDSERCNGATSIAQCSNWLSEMFTQDSRIGIWMVDLEIFTDYLINALLDTDIFNDYIVSIDDRPIKYLHFYMNDGSMKASRIHLQLASFTNVFVIEDLLDSNPIQQTPNCFDEDSDEITELLAGSQFLRGYYNSIPLIDKLFGLVSSTPGLPENFNFRQIPGNYFQSLVRQTENGEHFQFEGWNKTKIYLDDLADEILPYKLTYYEEKNPVVGVLFLEDTHAPVFQNEEILSLFSRFDFVPIPQGETATVVLTICLSITGAITVAVILLLYQKYKIAYKWDIRAEDVIFNTRSRRTDNKFEHSGLPTSRNTLIVNVIGNLYLPKRQHAAVGVIKGKHPRLVAYKPINRSSRLILSKKDEEIAHNLISMKHENIVKFEGIIKEINGVSYSLRLSEYVNKGSLYDILRDEAAFPSLSLQMKICFVKDIVNGMLYIQKSPIGGHGRLTSKNCLVDSRFQIKISDFETILTDKFHQRGCKDSELFLEQLLWIDPSLVQNSDFQLIPNLEKTQFRTFDVPRGTTKKHDVYSFGIILQEIVYRRGPFFVGANEPMPVNKKVSGIIDGTLKPLTDDYINTSLSYQTKLILTNCLSLNLPDRIPDFRHIWSQLSKVFPVERNVIEIILETLENYARDLEKQVSARKIDYLEEKERADEINYQLLPKSVAEEFKASNAVETRTYNNISLYFSDIVGFTAIGKKSSPKQIMEMMDSLFKLFDSIISKFNCTKIETIGDAYFVVSGCPEEFEDHAREVARFALAIRNSYVVDFKIPHLPKHRLQMRIGLHSGSVVASVVGKKMPRWCLFGEDLTTVANCESNGEANKIHLSSSIYEKLVNVKGDDNERMFDIASENYAQHLSFNFEIAERRLDFGNDEQRRKSLSSYEALGQTYFLIRDRFEQQKVYTTAEPGRLTGTQTQRRTRHSSLGDIEERKISTKSDQQVIRNDRLSHLDTLDFHRNDRSGIRVDTGSFEEEFRESLTKSVIFEGNIFNVRIRTNSL